MISLNIATAEFNQALEELARASWTDDGVIVMNTAKFTLSNLVRMTPEMSEGSASIRRLKRRAQKSQYWARQLDFIKRFGSGRAKVGWYPAWKALRMPGTPGLRNKQMRNKGEGGYVDRTRALGRPFFTMINNVPYIAELEAKKGILAKALSRQTRYMRNSIERIYTATLKRKSGRRRGA